MDRKKLFHEYREYFLNNQDYDSMILDFPVNQDHIDGNIDFNELNNNWWITLIDPFMNINPIIWSKKSLSTNFYKSIIKPILLLDSNVMNALHDFVIQKVDIPKEQYNSILLFLKYFTENRFEISPIFYFLESIYKSNPQNIQKYINNRFITIFKLHTMDIDYFMSTGKVISNKIKSKDHLLKLGYSSIDELCRINYKSLIEVKKNYSLDYIIRLSYLSLLNIALINSEKGSPFDKYKKAIDFFENEIKISGSCELTFALLFFYNTAKYQRFLPPLQKGMNFKKYSKKLSSSAWDLLLLRFPHMLISSNKRPNLNQTFDYIKSYICTAEKALRDLFSVYKIEMIFSLKSNDFNNKAITSINLNKLKNFLPASDFKKLEEIIVKNNQIIRRIENQKVIEENISNYIKIAELKVKEKIIF